eukprot:362227-Chlamydomonas_euryale.AAC.5
MKAEGGRRGKVAGQAEGGRRGGCRAGGRRAEGEGCRAGGRRAEGKLRGRLQEDGDVGPRGRRKEGGKEGCRGRRKDHLVLFGITSTPFSTMITLGAPPRMSFWMPKQPLFGITDVPPPSNAQHLFIPHNAFPTSFGIALRWLSDSTCFALDPPTSVHNGLPTALHKGLAR